MYNLLQAADVFIYRLKGVAVQEEARGGVLPEVDAISLHQAKKGDIAISVECA